MSEEPSGSHRLPDDTPIRVPRSILALIIAALVGGGSGSGLTALVHSVGGSDVAVALVEIKGQLVEINHKLDDTRLTLDKHEARINALELANARNGGK